MNAASWAGGALVLFGVTEFALRRGATARTLRTTRQDRYTTPLIFGCYGAVVLLLSLHIRFGTILPPGAKWSGAIAAYFGLLLRWWAMLTLGRFYTRTLTTTESQTVVRSGPYRVLRHPGYTGSLLTWGGAAMASGNVIVMAAVSVVLIAVYLRRIEAEESMLVSALGPAYVEYQKRTAKLVPCVF